MRILYVTTIGNTMRFFFSFITELINGGHTVDIATNENNGETPVTDDYRKIGCKIFPIPCSRSPISKGNLDTVKEIRKIVSDKHYDIVHCHTPIAATCTRVACRKVRKTGTRVFYTAHGFHFYRGASVKNWIIYYPVEWICSWWTDTLITINTEDYERAKKCFHAGRTEYVPGVGIDAKKFGRSCDGNRIRKEFNITGFMLLSVGELNENKNHEAVIHAIVGLPLTYVIVGKGERKDKLKEVAEKKGVNVILSGYRLDVADFYAAADAYILPSIREGLNVSLMEAMVSRLACCVGDIRGNRDLMDEKGGVLFDPRNVQSIRNAVEKIIKEDRGKMGSYNLKKIREFDKNKVEIALRNIYQGRYASDCSGWEIGR